MPVALETFLSQLSSSGIVPEDKLKVVVSKKASFADGEALARDMIKSRLLTKYQAEQILGGKGKSLTMGKYQILEKIGAGGMGQVYKAFHCSTERIVAIKVILGKGRIGPEVVKRFEREVKAAAKLVHANIITVFDADQADGRIFMVMEYIKGDDLGGLLRKKRQLSVSEVVDYILQAARGLKYAHDQGVIHRDIKPGNILVDLSGNVKIVDMGMAKLESKGDEESISMLTASASIMGTVDFMSPEQGFSSKNVDARADIYSLGATLFFLLTRKVMFPGDSAFEKLLAHREAPIPSLSNSRVGITPDLEIAFTKMVAKKVEDRYASMAEVISALSRIELEGGVNSIGAQGLASTHFERGSYPETIDVETVLTNKGGEGNKETDKHIGEKTLAHISGILQKTHTPKVLAATAIIVLVLLVLLLLMKPGTNVKEEVKAQLAELVKLKQQEEAKGKQVGLEKSKQEEEAKGKQVGLEKLKQQEEAMFAAIEKEMVLISAGKFMMGSPASEKGRSVDETQHEVTITKPYYMGKYEVTQEQWEAVMGNNPSRIKGTKLPVTDVSWEDCQEFIKKLNAKKEGGYRLPTEAEWEYACRAGTTTAYSFGEEIAPKDANYASSMLGKPVVVGSYKSNAFGLYDMHGNVREWCEDWFGPYPTGSVTDPKGPATGERWALRGGGFVNDETYERSSDRNYYNPPDKRGAVVGFRLAMTADVKAAVAPVIPNPKPEEIMPGARVLVAPFDEAKAKEVQKSLAKSLQKEVEEEVDLGKGIKLDLVLIPAGKFLMGDPGKDHQVTLTKPYYMGKYEVTQEQWEGVMGDNPSVIKGAKLPVTKVSRLDCQEFIKKLNAKMDGGYRLPTESEWEYGCRAGTTTAYSYGDEITPKDANYDDSKIGKSLAVGSYKPNAFNLYDMHGNVWEWCEDWYGDYPVGEVTDLRGPATGKYRVIRGGSFVNLGGGPKARSSARIPCTPTARNHNLGFRLARTADVKAAVAPVIPNPKPGEIMPATGDLLVTPFTETKAKETQKEAAKSLQKEVEENADLGKGIKLEMVLIPAGKFMMGSPASEKGHRRDREAQHEVTLTKPFYMGKYEVTQEQWEAVMGDNLSNRTKGAKFPVTDVWGDYCQEFIKKLNANTSGGYRLPTEAEWEYACRAGTITAYSFGDKITPKDANYTDSRLGKSVVVGSYNPNAFGLYDMHGNVREWCEDWYGPYPTGSVTDPKGPVTGERWALRGGCFVNDETQVRSSARNYYNLHEEKSNGPVVGFRLARTVDVKAAIAPTIPKPDPVELMPVSGNLLASPFSEAKAKEVQKEVAKNLKKEVEEKEDLGKGIKLEMVIIPAGKFLMGSPEENQDVILTKPFYLGKHEVTQEQWEAVMGDNPSQVKGARLPVTMVSWEDCQEFIKKLNAKTSGVYRLPTEAEWEYACRAGTMTAYSFGDKITPKDANYTGSKLGKCVSVGSYKPNAFELYDMHGNVREWCEDWRGVYLAGTVTDPKGLPMGEYRVVRGGAFSYNESSACSSRRGNGTPSYRGISNGFRLARTP